MYHQYDIPTNPSTSQPARPSFPLTRWRLLLSGLILFTTFPAFAASTYLPLTGVSQLWKSGVNSSASPRSSPRRVDKAVAVIHPVRDSKE